MAPVVVRRETRPVNRLNSALVAPLASSMGATSGAQSQTGVPNLLARISEVDASVTPFYDNLLRFFGGMWFADKIAILRRVAIFYRLTRFIVSLPHRL